MQSSLSHVLSCSDPLQPQDKSPAVDHGPPSDKGELSHSLPKLCRARQALEPSMTNSW
jgi:hypothetical protein